MPPFLSDSEQMKSHELTSEQVLRLLGCDDGKHKVEKEYSGDAVDAAKASGNYKNVQLYQYVLYKKNAHGGWDKVKIDKNWFRGTGLNAYALYGENGIVITRPLTLAGDNKFASKFVSNPPPNKNLSTNNESSDNNYGSADNDSNNSSWETSGGPGTEYEVKSYAGNDQEIIQRVSFVKLCLLKDIYECLTATVL